MKIFQILVLIIVFFTIQAQADLMTDVYQFTNLTQNRALVKYESHWPVLKKGHEVKPGECLYIHHNDFNHLSISLFIESSTLMFCDSNETPICKPEHYTLTYSKGVIHKDAPPDPSIIELSYIRSTDLSDFSLAEIHRLMFMKKRPVHTEECDVF